MTLPAPRGPLSYSEHLMGQSLLLSQEFLRFANHSDVTPASDAIKFEMIQRPDPDLDYFAIENVQAVRPFVCIWPFNIDAVRIGSSAIQFGGSVQLLFECNWCAALEDDPNIDPTNESEIIRWWKNRIGMIITESFAGAHDRIFNIRRIGQLAWWTRNPLEPSDQHLGFTCVVEWGPDEP